MSTPTYFRSAGASVDSNIAEAGVDLKTIERLRSWIMAAKPQTIEIGLDTELINEGVLDSLLMVNFVLYIEELRGEEIPEALIHTHFFASLRVIYDTFFRS